LAAGTNPNDSGTGIDVAMSVLPTKKPDAMQTPGLQIGNRVSGIVTGNGLVVEIQVFSLDTRTGLAKLWPPFVVEKRTVTKKTL
jgi:hypothetical protein